MTKKQSFKIFLCWTMNTAVAFQRMIFPAKYMTRMKDIEVAFSNPRFYEEEIIHWQTEVEHSSLIQRQLEVLFRVADKSVFQIVYNPWAMCFMQALRQKYKKPIITEIDDYIFAPPAYNIASNVYQAGSSVEFISKKHLELSDAVIVSTPYLKKLYTSYNKNIHVVPNGIDFEIWDKLKCPSKSKKIKIGFAGGPNHTKDIEYIGKAIFQIRDEYPNVEFVFFGCEVKMLQNQVRINTINEWQTSDKYPQALRNKNFDIGIAPLLDNNFNRGKSNLRWLEYSALKIPTIASPVIPFAESIQDGKTGLLAQNHNDWVAAMRKLIDNENLRVDIGNRAYRKVKSNHNMKTVARDYVDILKGVKLNVRTGST